MNRRQFICLAAATVAATSAAPAWASQIEMTVYKDPNCGCCHVWTQAMKNAGFAVEAEAVDDLDAIKKRFAVPMDIRGCHTAIVEG
jgi:hypothetical protein